MNATETSRSVSCQKDDHAAFTSEVARQHFDALADSQRRLIHWQSLDDEAVQLYGSFERNSPLVLSTPSSCMRTPHE